MKKMRRVALGIALGLLAAQPVRLQGQTPAGAPAALPPQAGEPSEPQQTAERPVSWKRFAPNVLEDQKRIWLFPKNLAEGKHWIPAFGFVFATGALVALDPRDAPYFRRTKSYSGFNRITSSSNTITAMGIVPASFYVAGLIRRDDFMKQTVELGAEAVLDGEAVDLVMRDISRRQSPSEILPSGDFSDTWFRRNKGLIYVGSGGFPSGHATAAVSLATVFARRYSNHRWVPWVAYGLAGVVCFSRISLSDHFPSDVFAGAALGYAITRYGVLRQP